MSIEKGDATKYVHTGNGELCYELNKALTVPETFPIYLSSAYIFDSIDPIDKICDEGAPGYAYFRLGNPNADATSQILAVGEGGGELAKQLLGRTYDFARPQVIAIYLTGKPRPGIGPHDVALSICGAVYKKGYVKNKVMEFIGDGIANLNVEYRNGIDVMLSLIHI